MARKEQEIFDELAQLCVAPGYVHAVAHLSLRDNVVRYSGSMTVKDMEHLFSPQRLLRTEICTVIGLMVKAPVDLTLPEPDVLRHYIERSDALLAELHEAISERVLRPAEWQKMLDEGTDPFERGSGLQEPFFYGGESAYIFQYRDFAVPKYERDDAWLRSNEGFTIDAARRVITAIARIQDNKLTALFNALRGQRVGSQSVLPGFLFTVGEVAGHASLPAGVVEAVLTAFTLRAEDRNAAFMTPYMFNTVNASPLLSLRDGESLLLCPYSLAEALYESPFYWMSADPTYQPTAMENRGLFVEDFAYRRLVSVFGAAHVQKNINVLESKGKRIGEIDVFVTFTDRAVVLQAKSKRLTLAARKGDEHQIKEDFRQSVQASYDQGLACASVLNDSRYKLVNAAGQEISVNRGFKEIFILCIVSDHYPALSLQARQFLKHQPTDIIRPPFVLDVFTLDAITEMLSSPLRMLSYMSQRTQYADRVMAMHELTVLSYHLKRNLWLGDEVDVVWLGDDISADLDIAMTVRREGVEGKATPDGILSRLQDTPFGQLIGDIESAANPAAVDLGFLLLTLGEDTVGLLNEAIRKIAAAARRDHMPHDVTITIGTDRTGLTIHCNDAPTSLAEGRLRGHCELRKYTERARHWFGVCLGSNDARLRFAGHLEYPWVQDAQMDELTAGMARPIEPSKVRLELRQKKAKVGVNAPCPCGSGRKYKKCCLRRG